jgi:trimethylamine--corrinoid protein Co-methyltransferase
VTTEVRVLGAGTWAEIHERSLGVLARTGVRVDSARARAILLAAGAGVDEASAVVRFPRALVESSLAAAPRAFALGGRRPGWEHPLNAGRCTLMADGEAVSMVDALSGERRSATHEDWVAATRLVDSLDEVGVYWRMVDAGLGDGSAGAAVRHWREALGLFSKHVQDAAVDVAQGAWLVEVLEVVFGDRETIRERKPFSFLLCPLSPLVLEGPYTDAWLATLDLCLPVAAMPMPLMGLTAPAGLLSTVVLANVEVLATLCLVQAAAPATPFIYAAAPAVMDPRSGRYGAGAPEHALLGAAVTEVARGYGLPVIASVGGTDHLVPGIQAAYERATNWVLPALGWPDVLVGPGVLGGATVLSLEQLVLDVEVFRRCDRMRRGLASGLGEAPGTALEEVGPGGSFLGRRATRDAVRGGEWSLDRLGFHGTYESWDAAGRPGLIEELRATIATAISGHEPLRLDDAAVRALDEIEQCASQQEAGPRAIAGRGGR